MYFEQPFGALSIVDVFFLLIGKCNDYLSGTMEDGQHLTYTFWGLLVLLSLETYELVDCQEYITNTIII